MFNSGLCRAMLTVAAVLAATNAYAAVYKCEVGGKAVYQSVPCSGPGERINANPSSGPSAPYWRKSAGERDIEKIERIEREREYNRDVSRAERRHDDAIKSLDRDHCNRIAAKIDRYKEHERGGGRVRRIEWYKAERKAAETRYGRECR